eukprot:4109050-Pyramimonas_sp.AAC.1
MGPMPSQGTDSVYSMGPILYIQVSRGTDSVYPTGPMPFSTSQRLEARHGARGTGSASTALVDGSERLFF